MCSTSSYSHPIPALPSPTAAISCRISPTNYTVRQGHYQVQFLHDNTKLYVANNTRQKLLKLGWDVLPHPQYSPDLAPTNHHLFYALDNYRRQNRFNDYAEVKNWVTDFFDLQPAQFYRDGIRSLPDHWQTVMVITLLNDLFCFLKTLGCMKCSRNRQKLPIDSLEKHGI